MSPTELNSIEVCIVAFDNVETIEDCIGSLGQLGPRTRIALADNHPDQTTASLARDAATSAGLSFRSIARLDNPGFAVASNELASSSTAEWLLFLNPDAVVRVWPGTDVLRPGITAPEIYGASGRREYSFGRERTIADELSRRLQIRPRVPEGKGYVSGAAILIRRDQFMELGGFDERYFMYYEDIDLCRTLVGQGGEVRLDSSFVVSHIGGYSAAKVPASTALRSYESARRYYEKWTGTTRWIDLVVLIDSLVRAGLGTTLPIPGAQGARATLRPAWSNLRHRPVATHASADDTRSAD